MARDNFGWGSFALRLLFAILLVLLSYNPHEYSYYHWAIAQLPDVGPEKVIAGLVLLIGWIIFLRATFRSLGAIGIFLALALMGAVVWLLIARGFLAPESPQTLSYVILAIISIVLAIGMSWSFVRRRLAGQLDVDDVES